MKAHYSKILLFIVSLTVLPFLLSTTCLKEDEEITVIFYTYHGYSNFIDKGESVKFQADVSGGTGDYSYAWYFSGGSPDYSYEHFPEITYWNSGSYNVSLSIIDGDGNSKYETKSNYITVYSTSNDPNNINPYYEEIEADEEY